MNQLMRLKDTVVQAVKRRRTVGPTTPSRDVKEHLYLTPASEIQDKKAQATAFGRLNQKYLSPSDTKNPRKRAREDDDDEDTQFTYSGVSPEDSISQISPVESETGASQVTPATEGDVGEELEDEVEEEVEDEVSPEVKVQEYLARQEELAKRKGDIESFKAAGGYHADELFLLERITLRSFEGLLPVTWQIDFPTLPEVMFTEEPEKMFIDFNCTSSFRGVKALQSLISLGVRVRDKIAVGRSAEKLIAKEIQNYIKWSEKDGGFAKKRFIPVLSVIEARPKQQSDSLGATITSQMQFLAKKHRENLAEGINEDGQTVYRRQPPLLYGIIVAKGNAIFVTLDSANPDAQLRPFRFQNFDFKNKDEGVWNGFAIAIMVIVARNYIMSIKDELEDDDEPVEDVDA